VGIIAGKERQKAQMKTACSSEYYCKNTANFQEG
jgi:hypothetical protein